MDKLKMQTTNKANENFKKLAAMFPNAITETIDETTGEVVRAIDKDVLMQEISTKVVEGNEERYQFTWPDKKKSVLLANAPINKTLRPCREESVDFDNTENLYIEGDNLEVLKLLQETYLGKIKMIYIDPPYNTGNDFVYEDDFAQSTEEYLENSGQFDDEGNRLVKNLDSNGRFHTDWLNMIYPRLKIAKDLMKQDGIIAGLSVFERVFQILDPEAKVEFHCEDGDAVSKGQLLAVVSGNAHAILTGERTALNYLQRMSGIATYTNQVVSLLEGSSIRLLDTRKTTPNMRIFEKYAVRVGGGYNHRYNLSDGVLLKDNHINAAGGVAEAVKAAQEYAPFVRKIEVETETLEMVREAVEAGADIIMLDNMTPEDMKKAVEITAGKAKTECSGNVTRENIENLKKIGVDYISCGALTHSAPILDVSLKNFFPYPL